MGECAVFSLRSLFSSHNCASSGPARRTIEVLFRAFEVAKRSDGLLELFRNSPRPPSVVAFKSAVSACANAGDWRGAVEVLAFHTPIMLRTNYVSVSLALPKRTTHDPHRHDEG